MVRAAAPVGPDGHADQAVHRPLTVAEHVAPAEFGEELVQPGPEVIGELHLDDGFAPRGAHAHGGANDEGLLDGRVEHAVVAKFLAQGGRFTEHPAQPGADVLAVEQCLGVVLHDLLHGVQRAIDHQCRFSVRGMAFATLFGHCRRRVAVGKEVGCLGLVGGLGSVKGLLDSRVDLGIEEVDFGLVEAGLDQLRFEFGKGVALGGFVEVVAVEFPAHAAGVVAEKGNACVHQERPLFLAGGSYGLRHDVTARVPVGAVHRENLNAWESLGKRGGISKPHLGAVRADVPFVVLHEPHHGQLAQGGHVKGLGDFAFGHRGVANAAQGDALLALHALDACGFAIANGMGLEVHLLQVLQSHGAPRGGNGLHACGGTLMRNLGLSGTVQARMAVVGSAARERIVFFGKQLEHELLRRHAHGQQKAVVPVVAADVVLGLQQLACGNLDDFVSARTGVDVLGGQPSVLFEEVGHGPRSARRLVRLEQPCGCGRFRRLGHVPKIGACRPTSCQDRTTFVPWRCSSKNGKAQATILCSSMAGRKGGCPPSGRRRKSSLCATASTALAPTVWWWSSPTATEACTSISAIQTAAARFVATAPAVLWRGRAKKVWWGHASRCTPSMGCMRAKCAATESPASQ